MCVNLALPIVRLLNNSMINIYHIHIYHIFSKSSNYYHIVTYCMNIVYKKLLIKKIFL